MPVNREQLERFLYEESRLMDENRYRDWLALWDEGEVLYWVPSRDDMDPQREISIIYDDRTRLEQRVTRLESPAAHSQDPRSRMRRVISNVEFEEDGDGTVTVFSNFVLAEFRRGTQTIYAGRNVHRLRVQGDAIRMVEKKVLLLNNDDYLGNVTFLI